MFRQSARGLFDLLMASLAVATLMTGTPLGELLARGGRYALGMPSRPRSLLDYFGSQGSKASLAALTAPETASLVSTVARAYGAEPSVLKGFALASGADPRSADPQMNLTAAGRALLVARGAKESELATGSGRLRAVGQALPDLTRELGSADAALCALVLGLQPVQYAAERVRAERREPVLEAVESHLSPGLRPQVHQTVGLALQLATAYDLTLPVPKTARVGSKFGMRMDPISHATAKHNGVDFSVPTGTPVWASGRGAIKRAGEDGTNGKFLVVDHGRGITSSYCHNSELFASRGSKVAQGETIAHSGNTGRSTGPHLHYVVAIEGVAVDPLALFSASDRALVGVAVPAAPPKPSRPSVPPSPTPTRVAPAPIKTAPSPAKAGTAPTPARESAPAKEQAPPPAKADPEPAQEAPASSEPAPPPATAPAPPPSEELEAAPAPTGPEPEPAPEIGSE